MKELDIPQFGKRMRIAQAIAELKPRGSAPLQPAAAQHSENTTPTFGQTPPLSTPPSSAPLEHVSRATSIHSRRASSTTPTVPSMEAIKEGYTNTSTATSSVPTTPVTPSSAATKRESTGSMGHKKGKASVDNKDRLSFFGRSRKPAPT